MLEQHKMFQSDYKIIYRIIKDLHQELKTGKLNIENATRQNQKLMQENDRLKSGKAEK